MRPDRQFCARDFRAALRILEDRTTGIVIVEKAGFVYRGATTYQAAEATYKAPMTHSHILVGAFRFGDEIAPLMNKLNLAVSEINPATDGKDYDGYKTPNGNLLMDTHGGHITAVHAFHSVFCRSRELIGLPPRKLKRIPAAFDWKEESRIDPHDLLLKSPSLGAMFFIDGGLVDSAILSPRD